MSITFRDLILYNIRNLQNYMVEHDLDDIEASFETLNVGNGDPDSVDTAFISSYKMAGNGDVIDKALERYSQFLVKLPEDRLIFTSASFSAEAATINSFGMPSAIITPDFNFSSMSLVKFLDKLTEAIDKYNQSNVKFNFGNHLQPKSFDQTNRMIFKKRGSLKCVSTMIAEDINEGGSIPVDSDVIFDVINLPSVKYPSNGDLSTVKIGNLYVDYYGDVNGKLLREIVFGGNVHPVRVTEINSGISKELLTGLNTDKYEHVFVTESIIGQLSEHFEETQFERQSFDMLHSYAYIGNESSSDSEIDTHPLSFESLAKSGQVDVRDTNGNTALMLSIIQDLYSQQMDEENLPPAMFHNLDEKLVNFHLFRELHNIGASLSLKNNQGDDALSISVKHKNADIMELILQFDRDAGFTNFSDLNYQGVSIMDHAIATEDKKIIELLDEYVLSRSIHQVKHANALRSPRNPGM